MPNERLASVSALSTPDICCMELVTEPRAMTPCVHFINSLPAAVALSCTKPRLSASCLTLVDARTTTSLPSTLSFMLNFTSFATFPIQTFTKSFIFHKFAADKPINTPI